MEKPDASYESGNPLCGDRIGMEIKKTKVGGEKWKMEDIKFWGEGCAISQASASLLTEKAKGITVEEIKRLEYEDIRKILGIELSPVRMKCALLPLEVLQKIADLI